MAEGTLGVPGTGTYPIDGIGVALTTAINPATTALRQAATIGDGGGAANFAKVNASGDQLISALAIGGPLVAMVTPSTNGTAVASGATGFAAHLPPGASYTYTIANAQPGAAPTLLVTTANPSTATSTLIEQVNLATGTLAYVTATTAGTTASSTRSF